TYLDTFGGNFADLFIQDETAGIFVFLDQSVSLPAVLPGQVVEVSGVSTPGDFSPCIADARIRILGRGSLPKPRRLQFDELLGSSEDGQWAELEGVIRSGRVKTGRLFMNVATYGGTFLAIMPNYPENWATTLVDAKVAITGALAAIFNDRRQAVGFRLFVPEPSFIHVEEQPPADPFAIDPSTTISVAQFRPQGHLQRRIRVRATVTAVEPGRAFYVSDGRGNLQIQSASGCPAHAGDLVDVVGFPGSVEGRPGLQDAICRVGRGHSTSLVIPVPADEVLPSIIDSDPTGYGLEAGKKYDGQLVRIQGKILHSSRGADRYTVVLSAGGRTFSAELPSRGGAVDKLAETGAQVSLTGVCLVTFDQYRRGQYFRILLRSPDDIIVKERPPWWNLRRTLTALCITALLFTVAVTWILVLRRQVAQRTRQIRELSLIDPLTGAANRRHFDEELRAEFQQARDSGAPLALLMIDIDHFKALNDSEGHQRGDEYLIEVVRALQSVVTRRSGLVARYGGEEFAVILPDMPAEGARVIGETIRRRVEHLQIPNAGIAPGQHLSVSVGVAAWSGKDDGSPANLVSAADRALYRAKSLGRNRTIILQRNAERTCA
ncbi:MAG TPA: GGDEF domain-containing protein, partial [Bryobacteraceae bacterium]|nr:GGDEF domain-containing protein [Bryobacteraceae bacterium]